MTIKSAALAGAVLLAAGTISGAALAKNPMVGGAPMFANKTIVANAVNSKDHTTLVAAVKAAGLVDTLSGPGPFTVFAPTNQAFTKLPAGTVDNLLKPEAKAQLQAVQGEPLTISAKGKTIDVTDSKGDVGRITVANVMQSNGVIQVVNTVMLP